MMRQIEEHGKSVEEAITQALEKLDITRDEAEIEIIDEGAKGFLGLGGKDAVVVVRETPNAEKIAVNFLTEVTRLMGVPANCSATKTDEALNVVLEGDNMGIIIGRRGDTIDALQYLTNLVVNKQAGEFARVRLDSENYRAKRQETLVRLAKRLAGQVTRTRKSITLEPMSPSERRIIHATLQSYKSIHTFSTGDEPMRKVVIALQSREK